MNKEDKKTDEYEEGDINIYETPKEEQQVLANSEKNIQQYIEQVRDENSSNF